MKKFDTKKITYTSIMIALVFLSTSVIKIPIPITGGYINFGDAFVMLSGFILGPIYGAFAAGIGSALSDLIGPYAQWALPTFIIKGIMAFIIGYLSLKKDNKKIIFIIVLSFSFIWLSFNYILFNLLSSSITMNLESLILQLEGIKTQNELIILTSSVQKKLLVAGLGVPLLMSLILFVFLKISHIKFNLIYSISFIISGSFMVIGYYIAYYIIYGNYIVPIFEVPLNIIQFLCGLFVVHILLPIAQKIMKLNMTE